MKRRHEEDSNCEEYSSYLLRRNVNFLYVSEDIYRFNLAPVWLVLHLYVVSVYNLHLYV